MRTKWIALICLAMCLLFSVQIAYAAENSATATIDLVFDGITFTDSVQVEWNERYVVPEGGVKWDGTEEFIGYANKDNWKIIDADRFSYAEGQIAFMAKRGTSFDAVEQLAAKYGARIVFYMKFTEDYVIELVDDKSFMNMEQIIAELKVSNDLISSTVIPHYVSYHTENVIPNDNWNGATWDEENPADENWGVEAIHAVSAWDYSNFMREMNVGIIDSSFDANHNDIRYSDIVLLESDSTLTNQGDHGTHVTGTAVATHNTIGISGVFPKGTTIAVVPTRQRFDDGIFSNLAEYWCDFKASMIVCILGDALVMNRSQGLNHAINCELYGYSNKIDSGLGMHNAYSVPFSNYMNPFFDVLAEEEIEFVFISAAGNDNMDAYYATELFWITNEYFRNRLIVVGAVGEKDGTIEFATKFSEYVPGALGGSNWGTLVDVVAPGTNIYSCIRENGYGTMTGTSMAAPHVTGVAAMMMSIDPDMSGAKAKIIIRNQGKTISDGHGNTPHMLDALACVEEAFNRASGNGTLSVTAVNKSTNQYVYDVQVSIKPLKICQETETTNASTGVVYPYLKTLKLGQYEVTVSKDGYRSHTETITVTRDSTINLNVSLEPTDAPQITKGTLNGAVTFNSAGVNGIEVNVLNGTTHVVTLITNEAGQFAVDLEPGAYVLSIHSDGYVPISKEVTVFTGKTTTQNIELDKSSSEAKRGTLKGIITWDSIEIENAKINIKKGESLNLTMYSDQNGQFSVDLDEGSYTLLIEAEGYLPISKEIVLAEGEQTEYFELEKEIIKSVELMITVEDFYGNRISAKSVLTSEDGKEVQLNINGRGSVATLIPPGEYTIKTERIGCIAKSEKITIDEGESFDYKVQLDYDESGQWIYGTVWYHLNHCKDAIVQVKKEDQVIAETYSDEDSNYAFWLTNGEYTISATHNNSTVEIDVVLPANNNKIDISI